MYRPVLLTVTTFVFLLFGSILATHSQDSSEGDTGLTNSDIVKMVNAGLSEEIIVGTIRTQPANFDTSPETLIALKEKGISDAIIAAMINSKAPDTAHSDSSQQEVRLHDGTEVKLRLIKTISSETARVGDRVDFEVVEDVLADGVTVIHKGARAWGEVIEAEKKKSFGRKGKLNFTIDVVEAVDGQLAPSRTTTSHPVLTNAFLQAIWRCSPSPNVKFRVKGLHFRTCARPRWSKYLPTLVPRTTPRGNAMRPNTRTVAIVMDSESPVSQ